MAMKGSGEGLVEWKNLGLGSSLTLGGIKISGFHNRVQFSSKLLSFFLSSIMSLGLASFRKTLNWPWKELR